MIVAVTGANGHIGANLVRALLKGDRKVRALVHNHHKALDGLDVEIVQGDVSDPYSLVKAFTGAEIVYHLAAIISLSMNHWKEIEATNVTGTRNVVDACLKSGVRRLVHFSSIEALTQEPLDEPVDELRPLVDSHGCPPYDRSKAESEMEVRQGIEQGLDAVIVNPTAIIGPFDFQPSFFGEALLAMARGKLPALIEGGYDLVDVRDAVEAAIRAEVLGHIGAKYLLSGHWASVTDMAKLTEDILGVPAPRLVLPAWVARTGAPAMTAFNQLTGSRQLVTSVAIRALTHCNHSISHKRATRELGYRPRPLRDTLRDTFRWFQAAGLLETAKKEASPNKS
jgi:dihydroflavonol-4-reductase